MRPTDLTPERLHKLLLFYKLGMYFFLFAFFYDALGDSVTGFTIGYAICFAYYFQKYEHYKAIGQSNEQKDKEETS